MNSENENWNASFKSSCLDGRIRSNSGAQKIDFNSWIFDKVSIPKGAEVLELCCGTGNQTLEIARIIGNGGRIVALDLEQASLEKTKDKLSPFQGELTLICRNIDETDSALEEIGKSKKSFDMVFVSYGLYYSEEPKKLLDELVKWLKPSASIVVVGPHGKNNSHLFRLLEQSGVSMSYFSTWSSSKFMYEVVIPWCSEHFTLTNLNNITNEVIWESPKEVENYWNNTIFFDKSRKLEVRKNLKSYFEKTNKFINKKEIMLLQTSGLK